MHIPSSLIINADDFGFSTSKNAAIAECFFKGLINSTSVMTNMNSFEEAIKVSKENGFEDKIGLHVCLTEGKPLTDLSKTGLINNDGSFKKKEILNPVTFFSFKLRMMVKKEIEAQLKALCSKGIIPTHINSHHHIHTLPWLAPIFLKVAKKFNIKIRIAQTWNENKNVLVPLYRNMLNQIYKTKRINFTDRFETIKSYMPLIQPVEKICLTEIMVHPDLNDKKEIYDCFDDNFLENELCKMMR